jgi:hypothetical protein
VFDINVLGSCAHITKKNTDDFARIIVNGADKLIRILTQENVRVTGELILPRRQHEKICEAKEEILNLSQEIADPIKPAVLKRLISALEITSKMKCCEEIAERDEEYGDICSAFERCKYDDLVVITCLDKIFSEKDAFNILKNKLHCNCELKPYEKTLGPSGVYIICCRKN